MEEDYPWARAATAADNAANSSVSDRFTLEAFGAFGSRPIHAVDRVFKLRNESDGGCHSPRRLPSRPRKKQAPAASGTPIPAVVDKMAGAIAAKTRLAKKAEQIRPSPDSPPSPKGRSRWLVLQCYEQHCPALYKKVASDETATNRRFRPESARWKHEGKPPARRHEAV